MSASPYENKFQNAASLCALDAVPNQAIYGVGVWALVHRLADKGERIGKPIERS